MPRPIRELTILVVIAWLCQSSSLFAGATSADLRQRGKEVESMTAVERERLQRNWQQFQSLPEDRKQHFRQLYEQLEADRKSGGSQLNHTMQEYEKWLHTLSPGQRADLRQAKTAREKLDLVRRFKSVQDQRGESQALSDPRAEQEFDPRPWRNLRMIAQPLTQDELNKVMDALAESLPPNERNSIDQLDPKKDRWHRYRRIIQSSAAQAGGLQDWPDREQQAEMLAALAKSERAERLKAIKEEEQRRRRFVAVILCSFAADVQGELAAFHPKAEDHERLFEELDNTSREDLMQLNPEQVPDALMRRYYQRLQSSPEFQDFVKNQQQFKEFLIRLKNEAGMGGPPRPPGPPHGRDGPPQGDRFRDHDRPPPPRRGGEERGPPGRRPPPPPP